MSTSQIVSPVSFPIPLLDDHDHLPVLSDSSNATNPTSSAAISDTTSSAHSGVPDSSISLLSNDASSNISSPSASSSPLAEQPLGRGHRVKRAPTHLQDYVSHTVLCSLPQTSASTSCESSGTPYPLTNYVSCDRFSLSHKQFLAAVTASTDPTTFGEALSSPAWRLAMAQEIDALEKNGTWSIESLPPGKKAIGCKWVYKTKFGSDGIVERLKARLVARGDTQK